jgi:FKBP-type peptidyl-prolyl cis-trans isomerase
MKRLIPLAILALLIAGCGNRAEQTKAVKVANPKESAPAQATVPGPPPMAPPPAVKSVGKDGWMTLRSGLKYKDKKVGKGTEVKSGTRVTVQYKGWLDNGTVFDTSRKPDREPFSFTVDNGEVIKGWEEGVKGMKIGGIRELTIPSALAYGPEGRSPTIPPNATLHFEIEVIDASK